MDGVNRSSAAPPALSKRVQTETWKALQVTKLLGMAAKGRSTLEPLRTFSQWLPAWILLPAGQILASASGSSDKLSRSSGCGRRLSHYRRPEWKVEGLAFRTLHQSGYMEAGLGQSLDSILFRQ